VSLFWPRLADPSIKLSCYISNRKLYDKGSACAQNPSRQRGLGFEEPMGEDTVITGLPMAFGRSNSTRV